MDGLISVNHNQPWSAFYNHSMQLHDCTALEYEPCTVSAFGLPMQYNIIRVHIQALEFYYLYPHYLFLFLSTM